MIQILEINLPAQTNFKIMQTLRHYEGWKLGYDTKEGTNLDRPLAGLQARTYDLTLDECIYVDNDVRDHKRRNALNLYADIVLDIINTKTKLNAHRIFRFNYNYYDPVALTEWHTDIDIPNKYLSFLYNPHTNDGGTEFNINGEIKKFDSIAGQCLMFPSTIKHRGLPPVKNAGRYSMNIMIELENEY